MKIIEEVEALGGMTKAIESGMAKLRIEESATRKQVLYTFNYIVCVCALCTLLYRQYTQLLLSTADTLL